MAGSDIHETGIDLKDAISLEIGGPNRWKLKTLNAFLKDNGFARVEKRGKERCSYVSVTLWSHMCRVLQAGK